MVDVANDKNLTTEFRGDFNDLMAIYNQISMYDMHYSTVRVGLVSLMLTIATVSGGYLLDKHQIFAIVIGAMFLFIGMLLNLHFYSLTKACYLLQRKLESSTEIRGITMRHDVEIRKSMKDIYRSNNWKDSIKEDLPTKIYVIYAIAWMALLIINLSSAGAASTP